jgi:hypothetical protein
MVLSRPPRISLSHASREYTVGVPLKSYASVSWTYYFKK